MKIRYMLGLMLSSLVFVGFQAGNGADNNNDEEEDGVGILSLYKRGDELGPFLVNSQKNPSSGVWIFAAAKKQCSSFVIAPTVQAIKDGVEVSFHWYNNTADHPDYATSTKGGFVNKVTKWYPFNQLFYVKYDDAAHSTAGTKRHHNFQMMFRYTKADGSRPMVTDSTAAQRKYVRFLSSSARPAQLPGEFDGGAGTGKPFYTADELAIIVAGTDSIDDESYVEVKALQVALADLDHAVESDQFTPDQIKEEIERQESLGTSSFSEADDDVGASSILATIVGGALAAAKKVGSKVIDKTLDKGVEFVASGIVGFFKDKYGEKCLSTTSINLGTDITKVFLHDKTGH